jgi:DNA-binding transcriptional ArsR family regulator
VTAKRRHEGRAALDAVASPARQELLLALAEGPASVRELAERLGRTRSALHYHVGVLERAGMIEGVEQRGTGRDRETVYAPTSNELAVNARRSRVELDGVKRATGALLRHTQREMVRALDEMFASGQAVPGVPLAARGKARLSRTKLARAQALIRELFALFADAPSGRSQELYALTLVLTPSRDASKRRVR